MYKITCQRYELPSSDVPYYTYKSNGVYTKEQLKLYGTENTKRFVNRDQRSRQISLWQTKEADITDIAVILNNNLQTTRASKMGKYIEMVWEMKQILQLKPAHIQVCNVIFVMEAVGLQTLKPRHTHMSFNFPRFFLYFFQSVFHLLLPFLSFLCPLYLTFFTCLLVLGFFRCVYFKLHEIKRR